MSSMAYYLSLKKCMCRLRVLLWLFKARVFDQNKTRNKCAYMRIVRSSAHGYCDTGKQFNHPKNHYKIFCFNGNGRKEKNNISVGKHHPESQQDSINCAGSSYCGGSAFAYPHVYECRSYSCKQVVNKKSFGT